MKKEKRKTNDAGHEVARSVTRHRFLFLFIYVFVHVCVCVCVSVISSTNEVRPNRGTC